METTFRFVHAENEENVVTITEEKLQKLAKKYDWLIRANVVFKEEHDVKGVDKICEIELSAPGPRLFAKAQENSFEAAGAKVVNELKRQLEKRKASFQTH